MKHHGDKSTTLIGDMQGGGGFFLPIGNRLKTKKTAFTDGSESRVQIIFERNKRSPQREETNAALTHGARDKETKV